MKKNLDQLYYANQQLAKLPKHIKRQILGNKQYRYDTRFSPDKFFHLIATRLQLQDLMSITHGNQLYSTGSIILFEILNHLLGYNSINSAYGRLYCEFDCFYNNICKFLENWTGCKFTRVFNQSTIAKRINKVSTNDLIDILRYTAKYAIRSNIVKNKLNNYGYDTIIIDGTGVFSSQKNAIENACTKTSSKDNTVTHQVHMVAAIYTNGDEIMFADVEFVNNSDKSEFDKQGCELESCKKLLPRLFSSKPYTQLFLLDALFKSSAIMQLIEQHHQYYGINIGPEHSKELEQVLQRRLNNKNIIVPKVEMKYNDRDIVAYALIRHKLFKKYKYYYNILMVYDKQTNKLIACILTNIPELQTNLERAVKILLSRHWDIENQCFNVTKHGLIYAEWNRHRSSLYGIQNGIVISLIAMQYICLFKLSKQSCINPGWKWYVLLCALKNMTVLMRAAKI